MPFIQCPSCGKTCSIKLDTCPKCNASLTVAKQPRPATVNLSGMNVASAFNSTEPDARPLTPQATPPIPVQELTTTATQPVVAAPPAAPVPPAIPAPPVVPAIPAAPVTPIPAAAKAPSFCPQCGTPVSPGATFCGNCGHRLQSPTPPPVPNTPAGGATGQNGGYNPYR